MSSLNFNLHNLSARASAVLLLLSSQLCIASNSPEESSMVLDEVRRLEREYGGHVGFAAKNLLTGEVIGYNAAERFPTASVIKLPVMAAFFNLVDKKLIDPTAPVILTKDDKKPGSGVLQFMSDGTSLPLLDAVKLMIVLSDNTATNLVLDRMAPTHAETMRAINDILSEKGLKNTRILNRLYSWQTKLNTPEAIRYGIGVSTPEDMVILLEGLYKNTIADSISCKAMLDILKQQQLNDKIPRLLPVEQCEYLQVAHKTGTINETKVDVGLVLSDRATYAVAIFVDKHPDHAEITENRAVVLAAMISRAVWNSFTGMSGYVNRQPDTRHVDWNSFPGGSWLIYRSPLAPFPHAERNNGFTTRSGTFYPYFPHYADSSVTVFVPKGFQETEEGTNLIVHFHGHMNDNMGVLERYMMPQAMIAQKINALLVLPQGPYRAEDSFGGKMEDAGGLKRLVDDLLATMQKESVVTTTKLNRLIISAHSGGFRPAAFCLDRGGLNEHITGVFLFDALYGQHEFFRNWLNSGRGFLTGAYTDHLADEHEKFDAETSGEARTRMTFTRTSVPHEEVVQTFFGEWLSRLQRTWKLVN